MSFSFNFLARNSSSGNIDAGKAWIYNGTSTGSNETIATIAASGYFNAAQTTLVSPFPAGYTGTTGPLAVNDVIQVNGNDASGFYIVTSVTTNVTLASFETIGSIGTANILDGAVTTPKLADGAVTTVKLASAAVASGNIVAGAVSNAALDPSVLQYAVVSVSSAQLKDLVANPVQLVAAPGAGNAAVLVSADLGLKYGSVAYANQGQNLTIKYTGNSGDIASQTITDTGFINATASTYTNALPLVNNIAAATQVVNAGLFLCNVGGTDYITGDSTVKVFVAYRVIADLTA